MKAKCNLNVQLLLRIVIGINTKEYTMPKGNVQVLNIDMILLTRYVGWKLLEASVVQTESVN